MLFLCLSSGTSELAFLGITKTCSGSYYSGNEFFYLRKLDKKRPSDSGTVVIGKRSASYKQLYGATISSYPPVMSRIKSHTVKEALVYALFETYGLFCHRDHNYFFLILLARRQNYQKLLLKMLRYS